MAIMPGVEVRLLPEWKTEPVIQVRGLIFHSIVGSVQAAWNSFASSSNPLESNFLVASNGHIIQIQDTDRQADANGSGNAFYGSVETEDQGNPNIQPWTPMQLDALVAIARFYHDVHHVPLQAIPAHGGFGYGYHTMFGAPGPWTQVRGKTCPGTVRVQQFHQVLLPAIVGGNLDDMPSEQFFRDLQKEHHDFLHAEQDRLIQDYSKRLADINGNLKDIKAEVAK